ncbi:hypothetical protein AOQ84DRAFT_292603, partial [Glonium stellatum]
VGEGGWDNVAQLRRIAGWCGRYGIKFKLNTVVCSLNWREDMVERVRELAPFRWKVFQVLVVVGENENDLRKRDARKFVVSDEEFEYFCERHKGVKGFVAEPNRLMKSSYLILDEYMRFLDKGDGEEKTSESILDVGVQKALSQVHWDQESFAERGGIYDWTKEAGVSSSGEGCGGELGGVKKEELNW